MKITVIGHDIYCCDFLVARIDERAPPTICSMFAEAVQALDDQPDDYEEAEVVDGRLVKIQSEPRP